MKNLRHSRSVRLKATSYTKATRQGGFSKKYDSVQMYHSYLITQLLRSQIPSRLDIQVPWQGAWFRQGQKRTPKNLRIHLQMETLGTDWTQHPRGSYPLLSPCYSQRLHLLRHADFERKIICLDKEKDQAYPWTLRTTITLGTRLLRFDHRTWWKHHSEIRQTPVSSSRSWSALTLRKAC